jgi:hypothetical protein
MAREYTGDLVLRQVREGGKLVSAWVPKSQARQIHQDEVETKQARAIAALPPAPPVNTYQPRTYPAPAPAGPMTSAPILNGPLPAFPVPTAPPAPTTSTGPDTRIPGWWINAAIQNPSDDNQRFANAANALLPTLAPEDQRNLATYLAVNFKDVYGGYGTTKFDDAPTEITSAVRQQYLSPQRAQTAVHLLDRMKAAAGGQDMGKGYDFLNNAVNLINQFSVDGVMTREKYNQFQAAINGLVTGAGSGLSAYSNLAQLFNLPNFSAGPLMSNTPSNKLFT